MLPSEEGLYTLSDIYQYMYVSATEKAQDCQILICMKYLNSGTVIMIFLTFTMVTFVADLRNESTYHCPMLQPDRKYSNYTLETHHQNLLTQIIRSWQRRLKGLCIMS